MGKRTQKQRRKGGSGVFVPKATGREFEEFLQNAKSVELISRGSYGITLKIQYDPNAPPSPFKHMEPSMYGEPVTQLVLKVGLIRKDYIGPDARFMLNSTDLLGYLSETEFVNEVNNQTEVFLKTSKYGAPICPAVVYAQIIEKASNSKIPELIEQKMDRENYDLYLFHIFSMLFRYDAIRVSFLAMEMASGYTTLAEHEYKNYEAQNFAVVETPWPDVYAALLQITHLTGFSQGDFHGSNIMIKPDPMFPDHFQVLVIDYGLAVKLSREDKQRFEELLQSKQYLQALQYYCNPLSNSHQTELGKHAIYAYVCNPQNNKSYTDDAAFNASVQAALDRLEAHEQQNIELMDERVANWTPNSDTPKPERLPLANSFRNQLFAGVDAPVKEKVWLHDKPNFDKLIENMNNGDTMKELFHLIYSSTLKFDENQPRANFLRVILRFLDYLCKKGGTFPDKKKRAQLFMSIACCEHLVLLSTSRPCRSTREIVPEHPKFFNDDDFPCDDDYVPPKSFADLLNRHGWQKLEALDFANFLKYVLSPTAYEKPEYFASVFNKAPARPDAEKEVSYTDPLPFAEQDGGRHRRKSKYRRSRRRNGRVARTRKSNR